MKGGNKAMPFGPEDEGYDDTAASEQGNDGSDSADSCNQCG